MNALVKRDPVGVVARNQVTYPVIFGANGQPVRVITPEGEYPFTSGQPMAPRLAEGTPARAFVPSPYQNMIVRPRQQPGITLTPFETLRALADYDLIRIVISSLKGHCKGLPYEVVPRQEFEEDPSADAQVDTARRWMEVPDPYGHEEWDEWVDKLLEEALVTDAVSIIPRHTRSGQFVGLEIIDGATIKPLVDDRGRSPLPPSPAYQQIAFGMAETNLLGSQPLMLSEPGADRQFFSQRQGGTDNELWYWPRNRRARTLYGQSETERVLMTVNQAIRNSTYEMSYFTTGNLPDSLFSVPENWSIRQIEEAQATFDAMLSGQDDKRAGALRFVPDGKYIPTKVQQWQYEYVEFMARVIAWAFSVSALPIMKQVGRNPSEVLQSSAIAAGVKPLTNYICRVANRALRNELHLDKIQVRVGDEEDDARITSESVRTIAYAKCGILTWNAARKAAGQDPYPDAWADRPMLVGTDGSTVTFLDDIEKKLADDAANAEAARQAMANRLAAGNVGSGGASGGGDVGAPSGKLNAAATAPSEPATKGMIALHKYATSVQHELMQARRYALKRAAKGKPPLDGFVFHIVPPVVQKRILEGLGVAA